MARAIVNYTTSGVTTVLVFDAMSYDVEFAHFCGLDCDASVLRYE
jgi:hypothetical protein